MKKLFKRTLAVLLTVVMLVGVAPLSGFVGLKLPTWLDFSTKSSALADVGQCGENVYWTFDESSGTLTLSGTGDMYYDMAVYSFSDNYRIKRLFLTIFFS